MRLTLAGFVLAFSAAAAQAGYYENARYDFSIDYPDMFSFADAESDAGDGRSFHTADKTADLLVFGGWILDQAFPEEVRQREDFEKQEGWTVSYTSETSTDGASYSGLKADRIFYARIIPRCGGDGLAAYRLEYPASSKKKYDGVIRHLNANLKAGKRGC